METFVFYSTTLLPIISLFLGLMLSFLRTVASTE